ncbi:hypothetical protein [Clostridium estertheticum]|uniref:Uncharacterized protein n=1 Tax=Clostridium estertheticum TaxID=238834 RepID=A0A7Y3T0C4_9CLOT|nr:hypothetical protein [Clostridium estertheticum]NNU78348.1 hypothetical protein [Clostridium estertheticum]WBL45298.1 hypothetical protein LOR37_11340 [Clostridium estertheticum]
MELSQTIFEVEQYLNKLEDEYSKDGYEIEFVIKKLQNYVVVFHEEIEFKLIDEFKNVDTKQIHQIIDESVSKPKINIVNKSNERSIENNLERLSCTVYNGVKELNDSLRPIDLFSQPMPGSDSCIDFKKQMYKEADKFLKIDYNNTKFERMLNNVITAYGDGNFKECMNKAKSLNSRSIISELDSNLHKNKNKEDIKNVFQKYKTYFQECKIEYEHTVINLQNDLEPLLRQESQLIDEKVAKEYIKYIEIVYSNGEKKKVSFEKLCTPIDVNFLEEKIEDIIKLVE